VLLLALALFPGKSEAVTMGRKDITCPVCETVSQFNVLYSWGSYVYQKNPPQVVNWPMTQWFPHYICKNCNYAALAWDFRELTEETPPAIKKKVIRRIKQALKKLEKKETFEDYMKVPVSRRLEIAEACYQVQDKDREFWSRFYGAMAYHYDIEGQSKKAVQARKKTLEHVRKALEENKQPGLRKWFLLFSGAMKCYLDDKDGAVADFKKGLAATYYSKDNGPGDNKNADDYYSDFLFWYIKEALKDQKNSFKWYYQTASAYMIYHLHIDLSMMAVLVLTWLVLMALYLLIVAGGAHLFHLQLDMREYWAFTANVLLTLLIFLASYLLLKKYHLMFHLVPVLIIGVTWFTLTLLLQRIINSKHFENSRWAENGGRIVESPGWGTAKAMMLLAPVLVSVGMAVTSDTKATIGAFAQFNNGFEKYFNVGLEVLYHSFLASTLVFLAIIPVYFAVKRIAGTQLKQHVSDYIFVVLTSALILIGAAVYINLYQKQFPTGTFVIMGIVWVLAEASMESLIRRIKSQGVLFTRLKEILKSRLWWLTRIMFMAAPHIIGLAFHLKTSA
jgi:hypothetical protein